MARSVAGSVLSAVAAVAAVMAMALSSCSGNPSPHTTAVPPAAVPPAAVPPTAVPPTSRRATVTTGTARSSGTQAVQSRANAGEADTADSDSLDAGIADGEPKSATVDTRDSSVGAPSHRPRIGAVSHYVWVYAGPNRRRQPIGYVRPGTSVVLQSKDPVGGAGCRSGRWMHIEPRGYVCDDATTTLDLASPIFRALSDVVHERDDVLPYRYGYSTGAPMYGRVPTSEEVVREERRFLPVGRLARSGRPRSGYEELATYDVLRASDALPSYASPELPRMRGYAAGLVRKDIPSGSLLSFSRAIEARGRVYLLSTDLTLVPAERVRPFRETTFHGVTLGGDIALPIAWTRGAPRKKYRLLEDGTLEPTGGTWPPRTLLRLTGNRSRHRGKTYLETKNGGLFVRASDASVLEATSHRPSLVHPDEKWIEFSASKGLFTLYVGEQAIYSTLASPGRGGGAPRRGMSVEELVQGGYTPLGIYRITFKTRATTMTPEGVPNPKKHWIQDVPYTQYFRRPFAIHAAYWHEDFGMPKSGGCINLSPVDAKRVFDWSDPAVPTAWSGASSSKEMGLGTTVVIRR